MAVNRVDFGGKTLIDLTGDSLELPEQLLKGIIAHAKDGTPIVGTLEAGGSIGETTLWNGGKYTFGSFVLSEETTSEYIIATDEGEEMRGLLNDGESLNNSSVYSSINLIVTRRPTTGFNGSSYPSFLLASVLLTTYFGGGSGKCRASIYSDNYGSSRCSNSNSVGANVDYNKLSMKFNSSYKGSPDFEYLWLAWRGVK